MELDRNNRGARLSALLLATVLLLASKTPALAAKLDEQKVKTFAQDRQWLRLIHLAAPNTQVTKGTFYLSANNYRKVNALTELKANLERARSDSEYRCQFPARDEWLRREFLELSFAVIKPCPELDKWQAAQSINSISIVYPNHSVASPFGVFSHTFLKFNSALWPRDSTLHFALGFAAELDPQDSLVKMAVLGIFGGYTGKYSMTNYFAELNRYGEDEARDIYEYELNLSKAEIRLLLNHIWEIKDAEFNYFFLNGNCSYHLLTLLEVARTELELSSHFNFITLPLTSLKVVLAQEGLLRWQRWIPSKQTRQEQMTASLSANGRAFYHQWREQKTAAGFAPALRGLASADQTVVLNLLAETTRGEQESTGFRDEVLNLRSQLPPEKSIEMPLPKEVPEASHGAEAFAIGVGYEHDAEEAWAQLRYRFVLHNIMDPPQSYFRHITFEIGDLRLRYSGREKFKDSSFTLVNLLILKPWTNEQKGLSWQVRSRVYDFLESPYWQNNIGCGFTKNFKALNVYTMGIMDSFFDDDEKKGFGVYTGASLGFTFEFLRRMKLRGNLDHLWPVQSHREESFWQGEAGMSYSHSVNFSLQFGLASSARERSVLVEALTYF